MAERRDAVSNISEPDPSSPLPVTEIVQIINENGHEQLQLTDGRETKRCRFTKDFLRYPNMNTLCFCYTILQVESNYRIRFNREYTYKYCEVKANKFKTQYIL